MSAPLVAVSVLMDFVRILWVDINVPAIKDIDQMIYIQLALVSFISIFVFILFVPIVKPDVM